jgi:hypothetical protein
MVVVGKWVMSYRQKILEEDVDHVGGDFQESEVVLAGV